MASLEQGLAQGSFWAFATVFGAGVLTSLTPCVYPMIPITVSIFGARAAKSRASAFALATAYVMGIAVMYATLGVVAALGGWMVGSLLASAWFIVPLSLFFIALATSMFGLWEIRLPFGLQNRLSTVGGRGLWGAFAMGLVGGVLIAPCTGPVLAGILGYVATTRSIFLGAALLFTYALGIGVLFWVLATFAVALPKSGAWMEGVKSALGIALLVAALFYLQNVFLPLARYASGSWAFGAANAVLLVIGLFLGGIHLSFHDRTAVVVRKLLGIILITTSAFGLVNYAMTPSSHLPWVYNERAALGQAREQRKPVLVDFWARYCGPCKVMEATVMAHPAVRRELSRFILFKVDVSEDTNRDRDLQRRYRAHELPQLVLLDAAGAELARAGKVNTVEEMLAFLRHAR